MVMLIACALASKGVLRDLFCDGQEDLVDFRFRLD